VIAEKYTATAGVHWPDRVDLGEGSEDQISLSSAARPWPRPAPQGAGATGPPARRGAAPHRGITPPPPRRLTWRSSATRRREVRQQQATIDRDGDGKAGTNATFSAPATTSCASRARHHRLGRRRLPCCWSNAQVERHREARGGTAERDNRGVSEVPLRGFHLKVSPQRSGLRGSAADIPDQ